ncbi:hypothetical protein AAY473_035358 [Plecturocebus cupreus]
MGFCPVVQAGLEFLISGNPPTSSSQSVGITGRRGLGMFRRLVSNSWPQHFGKPRRVDYLRSGVQYQPGQHGETLSVLKILARCAAAPVVSATQEAEARESLEPGRQRLQLPRGWDYRHVPASPANCFFVCFFVGFLKWNLALLPRLERSGMISDEVLLLWPTLECNGTISAHCNLCLLGSSLSPALASQCGDYRHEPPHPAKARILIQASDSRAHPLSGAEKLEYSSIISTDCNLHLLGSSDSPASVAGITGMHHHTQTIFVFLVETGFHHVGQAVLELLTLGDLLTLTSQSTGIYSSLPLSPPLLWVAPLPRPGMGTRLLELLSQSTIHLVPYNNRRILSQFWKPEVQNQGIGKTVWLCYWSDIARSQLTATSASRFKLFSCLSPVSSWAYRCVPVHPTNFRIFSRRGFTTLTRLVSNS